MGYPNDTRQLVNYEQTGNQNEYTFEPGVCVLPLAQEPPTSESELQSWSPVVKLQLHAPYRVRKFTQVASKANSPAPVVAPGDTGSFIFMGGSIGIVNNLNATFTNFSWTIGSEYIFIENCVSRNQDGLVLGDPPYTWRTNELNLGKYGYQPPSVGAVAHAGRNALVGYRQGIDIVANPITGQLKNTWVYNSPSFFPGSLFYTDLGNGGVPVIPVSQA